MSQYQPYLSTVTIFSLYYKTNNIIKKFQIYALIFKYMYIFKKDAPSCNQIIFVTLLFQMF